MGLSLPHSRHLIVAKVAPQYGQTAAVSKTSKVRRHLEPIRITFDFRISLWGMGAPERNYR